jgi:hypothetical protein
MSAKMSVQEIEQAGRARREAWEAHRRAMDGARSPLPDEEEGDWFFSNERDGTITALACGPLVSFRFA